MKNRLELAKHFAELGYKVGAEIGTFDGYYAEVLLKNIPGLLLYCVDPWEVYRGYRDHKFHRSMELAEQKARERLTPLGCQIVKKRSMDAVKDIADNSLDFVYIDANHKYEFVKEDIEAWTPKVRTGGIVSGHDYYITKAGNTGVVNAVNEYVALHNYELNLTEWDALNPNEDDRQHSWYFIK